MGLFSRRTKEPIVHPRVERTIYVETTARSLDDHLDGYAEIMGRHARDLDVVVWSSGGWLRLDLPDQGVHPWELHNLAYWLLELGDVVVVSGPSPELHGYHLVRADDPNDLMEGWTDAGEPMTVHVPGNDVVRPDPEVAMPASTRRDALQAAGVPHDGWTEIDRVTVRSEDPGHVLNPSMAATKPDRAALRRCHVDLF